MRICIIGGGTAGWLAALYIKKRHPWHEIHVVDSSRIGIIGTGEGSTGVFADTIHKLLGIPTEDFLLNTGATQKLGNRFHNWRGDGTSFIAPLDNTRTAEDRVDSSLIYHCKYHGGPHSAHLSTYCGTLAHSGLTSVHSTAQEIVPVHSYHFDGHRVGAYFKRLAIAQGIHHYDAEFVSCRRDESGRVTEAIFTDAVLIRADVWVDATGFARVLGSQVGAGWYSYSPWLSNDRAMPFQLPHLDQIDALTEAEALKAGWMWRIPVQERRGCGYVFDSDFLTADQAQAEIEQHLGHPIEPIKLIKFDPGRVEQTFAHNVATIGLAGNFLEPLQATNLHATITQLFALTELWLTPRGTVGPKTTAAINAHINRSFDQFADLIQTHYRSGRRDTDYWRHQQELPLRPRLSMLEELCQSRWPTIDDWGDISFGGAGYGVSIYPMLEYGWLDSVLDRYQFDNLERVRAVYEQEQSRIQSVRDHAMNNTELVRRLQQGYIQAPPPRLPRNLPATLSRWLGVQGLPPARSATAVKRNF